MVSRIGGQGSHKMGKILGVKCENNIDESSAFYKQCLDIKNSIEITKGLIEKKWEEWVQQKIEKEYL